MQQGHTRVVDEQTFRQNWASFLSKASAFCKSLQAQRLEFCFWEPQKWCDGSWWAINCLAFFLVKTKGKQGSKKGIVSSDIVRCTRAFGIVRCALRTAREQKQNKFQNKSRQTFWDSEMWAQLLSLESWVHARTLELILFFTKTKPL